MHKQAINSKKSFSKIKPPLILKYEVLKKRQGTHNPVINIFKVKPILHCNLQPNCSNSEDTIPDSA